MLCYSGDWRCEDELTDEHKYFTRTSRNFRNSDSKVFRLRVRYKDSHIRGVNKSGKKRQIR